MSTRTWILGAADPEMQAIESLLRECGERVADMYGDRARGFAGGYLTGGAS